MAVIKEIVSLIFLIYIMSVSSVGHNSLETKFLDVPIDHFIATDGANKFKLRYLTDNQFHDHEGPIFVYLGHQEDVELFARNTGFLYDIAPKFNALIVYIEHRYYGQSLPFGDETFKKQENMRYLSTTQALADFNLVINHLISKYYKEKTEGSLPIIVFGGGYGGNLAAWLRMKYPFFVKGAISSSAPLIYSKDETKCGKFYEKVTDIFEEYGRKNCVDAIKLSWDIIINVSKSKIGREFVTSSLKLCRAIKGDEDVEKLFNWLSNVYVELATFNYHYPTVYYKSLPAYPVKVFCDKLTTSYYNDTKGLIEHFGHAVAIYTNYTNDVVCNNIDDFVENPAKFSWNHQICNELITPICSTDSDMFFNRPWNMEKFNAYCLNNFGIKNRTIDLPLINYGGFNLKYYSNIMISNGLSDPWSVYGILNNISSSVTVFNIENGPHHVDLRSYDSADNNYILNVRRKQVEAIKQWLSE